MPPGPDPQKRPAPGNPPPRPSLPGNPPPPPRGNRPPPPGTVRRQARPPTPRPKRRHHHGRAGRARIGLLVIFALFRVLDFLFLLGVEPEAMRSALATIITSALWTTSLLIAIAFRHAWARLILLALLALGTVALLIFIPMAFDKPALLTPLIGALLVDAGSFAWLFWSRDVHRLTSRDRE